MARKPKPVSAAQAASDTHETNRADALGALRDALQAFLVLGGTRHEAHELADRVHDGLHGLNQRAADLDEAKPYPLLGA